MNNLQLLQSTSQLGELMPAEGETKLTCAFLCAKRPLSGGEAVDLSVWEVDEDACSSPRNRTRLGGVADSGGDESLSLSLSLSLFLSLSLSFSLSLPPSRPRPVVWMRERERARERGDDAPQLCALHEQVR